MISVVFAAYNEEKNVSELHRRLKQVLSKMKEDFEIIAVDDGSTDGTLLELKKLLPIKIIVLSRNMGQAAALDAGIKSAKGDTIATIDADLQNDPEDILPLVGKLREGFDLVCGRRMSRKDSFFRKIASKFTNALAYRLTGLNIKDSAAPLKVCRANVLKDVNLYGGMHSFLPALLYKRGARIVEVPVVHHERAKGISKYGFIKLLAVFSDLLVIKFLADYFARPFLFFGGFGALSVLLGFIAGIGSVVLKVMELRNFTQTPLPTLAVLFIVVGFILIMMGFLGEILLRIYYESKKQTPYIIKEEISIL